MWNDRDQALLSAGFEKLTQAVNKQTAVLERIAVAVEAFGAPKDLTFTNYIVQPHTKESTDE